MRKNLYGFIIITKIHLWTKRLSICLSLVKIYLSPKSLIIVAGYDPLRDEGIKYAEKLIHFGNDVQLINYKNMVHGFF